jgi:hypothetical protein
VPGVPLPGPTGLRLLVASGAAPVVLDVDSGAVQPVTGLPAGDDRSVHLERVGEDAVVVSRRDCRGPDCDDDAAVFLVRHGGTVATRLAAGTDVEASRDGQGVWLLGRRDATGPADRPDRPGQRGQPSAPWPSRLDDHVMGLIEGHPAGRLATVAFYPARSGVEQTLDVWLLDLATRRWRRLPDMPLRLAPSKPQLQWTADGRLLLLAGLADEPESVVAVWRLPGPARPGGYRFAIW